MSGNKINGKSKLVMVDDIDTDQIFHQSLLTIHDPEKIKPHILGNLEGYENFGKEDNEEKILFVGRNFGKGSTRQQAVTGFITHKIQALVGESFGPIYYSNAVNAGLLLVEVPDISNFEVEDNDEIEIDITKSIVTNLTRQNTIAFEKIPQPVLDIINAGGLLKLGEIM